MFVRINSQGVPLGQVDFVLTLLSVYHGELRDRIEQRAAALTVDPIAALDTRQLLRATCGVAFGRARMRAIYRYLRGMDPMSGDTSIADRQARLNKLDVAADECIHATTWQDFILRVVAAGFVNQALIASTNAIVNAFTFYVLGQRHNVRKPVLDGFISRWVFTTLVSARYSAASETTFEEDLSRIRNLALADGPSFVGTLDNALSETIAGTIGVIRLSPRFRRSGGVPRLHLRFAQHRSSWAHGASFPTSSCRTSWLLLRRASVQPVKHITCSQWPGWHGQESLTGRS